VSERDLVKLAIPFPKRLVKSNPTGYGDYVPHSVYAQRLLLHLGGYDFELVEVLRGSAPAKDKDAPPMQNVVVGVVMRLTCEIDGRHTVIEEIGDCEIPSNWDTDGKRMKDAISDALKRCCARIGLGLHLYAKSEDEYMLLDSLRKQDAEVDADTHEPADAGTGEDHDSPEIVRSCARPTHSEDDPGRPFE
jgi:hypothetical protein